MSVVEVVVAEMSVECYCACGDERCALLAALEVVEICAEAAGDVRCVLEAVEVCAGGAGSTGGTTPRWMGVYLDEKT